MYKSMFIEKQQEIIYIDNNTLGNNDLDVLNEIILQLGLVHNFNYFTDDGILKIQANTVDTNAIKILLDKNRIAYKNGL